jgi:hypothetical protein
MMLYSLEGQLPWHRLRGETKEQTYQLIMDWKAGINMEDPCNNLPEEFRKYMNHVRALDFGDKPDYSRL